MRHIFVILCFVWLAAIGMAQSYSPKAGETVLKMEVEGRGNIFILLHTKEAPKTTARIVKLVSEGFYNTQRFHRVVQTPKPYLVEIGDPTSKTGDIASAGMGGSGTKIPFEDTNLKNVAGAVGLARNVDDKESGDSRFYMLLDRASFLDGNYTVFGQIIAGMDVLKKIQKGDRVVSMSVLKG